MNREQIIEEYFQPPFDLFLTLKDPREYENQDPDTQDDYLEMTGLSYEHIPHLIKIMDLWLEDDVWDMDTDDDTLIFAPIHVWRILGQLKSEEGMAKLLKDVDRMDKRGDDWYLEEFPYIFRNVGTKLFPALKKYLNEEEHEEYTYVCVIHCIKEVGTINSNARDTAIAILKDKLEKFEKNDITHNAFLITYLVDLKAVEAAELMERAFAADVVDSSVDGSWYAVKRLLGLEHGFGFLPETEPVEDNPYPSFEFKRKTQSYGEQSSKKTKNKRKASRRARKKNRKKKK